METAAVRTCSRGQAADRWRTGPVGCSVLGMKTTAAFAKNKKIRNAKMRMLTP